MRIERLEYQAQFLEELQRLKDDYQKHRQQQGFELTSQQKAELLALAEDLPRLAS